MKALSFVRVALRTLDRVSYREVNIHSNILKCPLFSAQLLTSTANIRRFSVPCNSSIYAKIPLIQVKSKNKTPESADLAMYSDRSKNRNLCHSLKYQIFTLTLFNKIAWFFCVFLGEFQNRFTELVLENEIAAYQKCDKRLVVLLLVSVEAKSLLCLLRGRDILLQKVMDMPVIIQFGNELPSSR